MNRFTLAILAAMLAAPAMAGNIVPTTVEAAPVVATAPVAPVYDWTGPYAGVQVSRGDLRAGVDGDLDDDGDDDDDDLAGELVDALDGDGVLYGLRAGYDYAFGRALVGGLVQYDKANIDLGDSGVELDDIFRIGARVGATAGRNLFYATGGYAKAGTSGDFDIGSADGYFAGAGYEAMIAPNLSMGIEALYHDFGDFDDANGLDVDADATTVGLNLNFRF